MTLTPWQPRLDINEGPFPRLTRSTHEGESHTQEEATPAEASGPAAAEASGSAVALRPQKIATQARPIRDLS